jgi:oxygen-independent coproporphyrinogen-3 oxidase
MHRTHTAAEALASLEVLRRCGVPSFSVDVIFGLPTSLSADVTGALERILEFEPHHLSVYGLTAEERTPLHRWIGRGKAALAPEVRYAEEFLSIHELLTAAGFEHYEVSNYARPGHRSRHNQAYWTGRDYLGLGPSAHSYVGGERHWNLAPWTAYERVVAQGLDPIEGRERLGPDERCLEALYLGLRTAEGASVAACGPLNRRVLLDATRVGWLAEAHGRVRLTAEGWLRLDEIVAALTTSVEGG